MIKLSLIRANSLNVYIRHNLNTNVIIEKYLIMIREKRIEN